MRWVQAWMLLAMSTLLEGCSTSAAKAAGQTTNDARPFEPLSSKAVGELVSHLLAKRRREKAMDEEMTADTAKAGSPYSYVLVTPARNEAAFIEGTLKSVVARRPAAPLGDR